jgi:hypothetical protein
VFVFGQASKIPDLFAPERPRISRVRVFQRSGNLFLSISNRICQILVALIAGVMRGFERVVALPDPKDIEFPSRFNCFVDLKASGPIGAIK